MKYMVLSLLLLSNVNLANESSDNVQLELSRIRIRLQTTVGMEIPLVAKINVRPMLEMHFEK